MIANGKEDRLCFRYMESTIPLLLLCKVSSFKLSSVTVQAGLCRTWSEAQIVFSRTGSIVVICIFQVHDGASLPYI